MTPDDPSPTIPTKHYFVRYGLALFAAVLALYLRHLLLPYLGLENPYHTAWIAVVFSAWYCGLGPSILAVIVDIVGIWYWFIPPTKSFNLPNAAGTYGIIGFLLISGMIVAIGETSRRSRLRLTGAEREAQEARILFESFMNNSPAVTYLKDESGKFLYSNRAANARFRQPTIVGKSDFELLPPEIASPLRDQDLMVFRENKPMEFLEHTTEDDGSHTWLTIKFPLITSNGRRLIGGKSFDITDRQRAEKALRRVQEELENRVQERTAELRKANESLGELSARLLQLQDEERRRLARELHDSVGQLLAAMNMNFAKVRAQINKLDSDGGRAILDNSMLVEQVSREIRTISHLLHPPLLDEVGLPFALRWYVDAFSERSKIRTAVEIPDDLTRLSTDLEIAVFRIVQECLTNIHRHSGSETAEIKVLQADHKLHVSVQDHGKGIPADLIALSASGPGGVGFRGMSERIRHLGGTLNVQSDSSGTTVTAILPVKAALPE